ncbi:zinc-binding dehydrogenase [Paenibacillus sp. URB8-2]|uniref:zinc-binding dehydrogenase n=1 Tax=Paenibacillus sp. URB8-2 TaxID=2741301 RepID=UPI0015BE7D16|nr:zinc-binding dehydrogenase [Paenibacillus sp. URB8-2]BCG58535.1 NADPH:quinone reductase [Paenibacillus sp. URB8-2]
MATNKRIVVNRFGGPEVLELIEEPVPKPKKNEVLIKNLVTGVAFGDIILRKGEAPFQKPPLTPGTEIVGIVKEAGPNVTTVKVGQLVAALPFFGGYTEHICLHQKELIPIPDGIDPKEAASLVLNYLMAYQLLHRYAHVQQGEKVLKVEMFGTASQTKHAYVSSLGATPIDYKNTDFVREINKYHPDGMDVVFDCMGGINFKKSYQILRKKDRVIGYGSGHLLPTLMTIMSRKFMPDGRRASLYFLILSKKTKPHWFKEDLITLFEMLRNRAFQPVINQTFPLSEAKAAHEMLENGVTGKVLLTMNP